MDGPEGRGEDITLWLVVTSIVAYSETNYYSSFKRFLDFYCIWLHIFVFLWQSVCTTNSQQWRWYSRLPAVHSAENAPSYLANQASLQLWIWAKQSGQAGCTHGRLPLHMDWAWTQETVLSFGRTCSDTWLLVEETHALLTPSLSALSSPETLQQQKALKEQWTQEQQQQFGQKGLQHPKKSVCSQG